MDSGEDGKRDGMERAERHADAHWWRTMMECAKQVAEVKPYLFTDDIVGLCKNLHPNASTHEHKAIGPLMRACCRLGYFEPTQDFRRERPAAKPSPTLPGLAQPDLHGGTS